MLTTTTFDSFVPRIRSVIGWSMLVWLAASGCGNSNGSDQGACGTYVDYYNNLPCVESEDRLDFLTTCPDTLSNAPCDLSDYYLCLTLGTSCVNGQIDDTRTVTCSVPCAVPSATPSPVATESPAPTASPAASPTPGASPAATPAASATPTASPVPSPSSPRVSVQPASVVADHLSGEACPDRLATVLITNRSNVSATVELESTSGFVEPDSDNLQLSRLGSAQTDLFFDCGTASTVQAVVDVTVRFSDGVVEQYEVGVLVRTRQ